MPNNNISAGSLNAAYHTFASAQSIDTHNLPKMMMEANEISQTDNAAAAAAPQQAHITGAAGITIDIRSLGVTRSMVS